MFSGHICRKSKNVECGASLSLSRGLYIYQVNKLSKENQKLHSADLTQIKQRCGEINIVDEINKKYLNVINRTKDSLQYQQ